jgi:hypothetical protein
MTDRWLFVVDTEQYSGNFERDLTAYMTGRVGECQVGEDQAKLFKKETKKDPDVLFSNVMYVPDGDNGCRRPCAIYPTPGWFNHGMGGEFRDGQEVEALVDYKKQVREYNENHIKNVKSADGPGWTKAVKTRDIKRMEKVIKEADALTQVQRYWAYLSVAIYFHSKPTAKQIALMKSRAKKFKLDKFSGEKQKELTITGFRLVEEATTQKETEV